MYYRVNFFWMLVFWNAFFINPEFFVWVLLSNSWCSLYVVELGVVYMLSNSLRFKFVLFHIMCLLTPVLFIYAFFVKYITLTRLSIRTKYLILILLNLTFYLIYIFKQIIKFALKQFIKRAQFSTYSIKQIHRKL